MSTKQIQVDFPDVQAAIYGVALSLDAFLLNGIQYGVLQRTLFPGFLQKTSGNLLRDLASLEGEASQASLGCQPKVTEVLATLRAKCRQLVDQVAKLSAFRTLPLQQVRALVVEILLLREDCVCVIKELEGCFRTPKPFYQTRPSDSTAAMTEFLAHLERALSEEWAASNSSPVEKADHNSAGVPPIVC